MLPCVLVGDVDAERRGAGCHCENCGNIHSECVDGSPIRRQLPSQECQVVEEEESMYDTQLCEKGGDKLVHLDEEELKGSVVKGDKSDFKKIVIHTEKTASIPSGFTRKNPVQNYA